MFYLCLFCAMLQDFIMPPGYNPAYHSLPDNNVYKSTTIPETKSSILDYLKKVLNSANSSTSHIAPLARRSEPLISPASNSKPVTVTNNRLVKSFIFLRKKTTKKQHFFCYYWLVAMYLRYVLCF